MCLPLSTMGREWTEQKAVRRYWHSWRRWDLKKKKSLHRMIMPGIGSVICYLTWRPFVVPWKFYSTSASFWVQWAWVCAAHITGEKASKSGLVAWLNCLLRSRHVRSAPACCHQTATLAIASSFVSGLTPAPPGSYTWLGVGLRLRPECRVL